MAKEVTVSRLSDTILGEGMYEKLKLREKQLSDLLFELNRTFGSTERSVAHNWATLHFMNGRVSNLEFNLALSIIKEAEQDLFELTLDINNLKKLRDDIAKITKSIVASRDSEDKILQVERFMNRRNTEQSSLVEHSSSLYFESLTKVKDQARLLEHSAAALVELKVGA